MGNENSSNTQQSFDNFQIEILSKSAFKMNMEYTLLM